jgi:hypothetical protein
VLQLLAGCAPTKLVHAGLWAPCAWPTDHHWRSSPVVGSTVPHTTTPRGLRDGDPEHSALPRLDPSALLTSKLPLLHGLTPCAAQLVDTVVATYLRWFQDETKPAATAAPHPSHVRVPTPAAFTGTPDLPPGTAHLLAAVETDTLTGSAVAPDTIARPSTSPPPSQQASKDPRSVGEALSGDFGPPGEWRSAMKDELERLINDFQAFVPVSRRRLPRGARPIPTTWVFQRQANPS